ncbi:MAG: hypothetical protein V3T31_11075 [candidate division Zixibacteria bacterium]
MTAEFVADNCLSETVFLNQTGIELKRAERYHIFVSLIAIDLETIFSGLGKNEPSLSCLCSRIRESVRASDNFAMVGEHCLAMLFPETPRQGAEATGRRIAEMIKSEMETRTGSQIDGVIPVEMASYPDTAGALTIADMIETLQTKTSN